MNEKQCFAVVNYFHDYRPDEFHHGDCIGADRQAHDLMRVTFPFTCVIHGHPPINDRKRAFCKCDMWYEAKDYIPRNHAIVDATDRLLAVTRTYDEEQRSGTWATIRYAIKVGKPVFIIRPDGVVRHS